MLRPTGRLFYVGRNVDPRALGLAPYAIVLYASGRSVWNLPEIEDAGMISGIKRTLYIFDALVVVAGAVFLVYVVRRKLIKADCRAH